jgi:hypothetical protein
MTRPREVATPGQHSHGQIFSYFGAATFTGEGDRTAGEPPFVGVLPPSLFLGCELAWVAVGDVNHVNFSLSASETSGWTKGRQSPPSFATSLAADEDTKDRSDAVGMKTVSISGAWVRLA